MAITVNEQTIILGVAAVVGLVGIVLALLTKPGREAFAGFGLRLGEALVNVLIGRVSAQKRQSWAARTLPRVIDAHAPEGLDKVLLRVIPYPPGPGSGTIPR